MIHRKNLLGVRAAAEQLWGNDGMKAILALLPADVVRATSGLVPLETWVPVSFSVAWFEAVWNGPAARRQAVFREYVALNIDLGFGRVKKFFLSMATPKLLAEQSETIWRTEFSSGNLKGRMVTDNSATILLTDHPFATQPFTKIVAAESFRRVVSYTVKTKVRDTQATTREGFVINLRWD